MRRLFKIKKQKYSAFHCVLQYLRNVLIEFSIKCNNNNDNKLKGGNLKKERKKVECATGKCT